MLKISLLLRNVQTSRANNSRILRIKNAKVIECFYMDTNIKEYFQICINVPLNCLCELSSGYTKYSTQK